MKVIVSFSGGKDSLASLLWVRNNLTKDFITVFCDTGWEHPLTYNRRSTGTTWLKSHYRQVKEVQRYGRFDKKEITLAILATEILHI